MIRSITSCGSWKRSAIPVSWTAIWQPYVVRTAERDRCMEVTTSKLTWRSDAGFSRCPFQCAPGPCQWRWHAANTAPGILPLGHTSLFPLTSWVSRNFKLKSSFCKPGYKRPTIPSIDSMIQRYRRTSTCYDSRKNHWLSMRRTVLLQMHFLSTPDDSSCEPRIWIPFTGIHFSSWNAWFSP